MAIDVKNTINDQLNMYTERKQLNLEARRIDVNEKQFHLVIGLGGTGVQALLETKGYIALTCKNPERRVAYMAFDADDHFLHSATSSPETGKAKLDASRAERVLLSATGLGGIFASSNIDIATRNFPEFFTWVDERISPLEGNSGANGIRQIGRLVLMHNYELIRSSIDRVRSRLLADAPSGSKLNVYILSGISGGTGSGTFIDFPYIVRKVLSERGGMTSSTGVYGYLFMPDVNLDNGGDPDSLKRNAYASLQELDYNMSLHELNESYTILYPKGGFTHPGQGTTPIYDYVHLVSATDHSGAPVGFPYKTSMRAIAQNILSFVADEQGKSENKDQMFAMDSHYSNIKQITRTFKDQLKNPSRYYEYLAIGSYNYELPIDDIMMYITHRLFEKMDAMYQKEPIEAEKEDFYKKMKVSNPRELLQAFASHPRLRTPEAPTFKDLKNEEAYWRDKAASLEQNRVYFDVDLSKKRVTLCNDLIQAFDEEVKRLFHNSDQGPVYVNRLIVGLNSGASAGILDKIEDIRVHFSALRNGGSQARAAEARGQYTEAIKKVKEAGILTGRSQKEALANAANDAGRKWYNAIVESLVAEHVEKVCTVLAEHIRGQNNKLYGIVKETLLSLKETFEKNANILTETHTEKNPGGEVFNWTRLSIPLMDKVLVDKFDGIFSQNGGLREVMTRFMENLWENALQWMRDETTYDPKGFVSEFVNMQFGELARLSIEDVVIALLGDGSDDLESTVKNRLMPMLIQESAPLFYPNQRIGLPSGSKEFFISIPSSCPRILAAAQEYISSKEASGELGTDGRYMIQRSEINNRIYAQSVGCAVPLAAYQLVWECERVYARLCNQPGLHLVHAVGEHASINPKKTWNDLCTLIPSVLRPKNSSDGNVERLVQAETAHKIRLRQMFDEQFVPKHSWIRLKKEAQEWSIEMDLSDVFVYFDVDKKNTLVFMRDGVELDRIELDASEKEELDQVKDNLFQKRKRGLSKSFASLGEAQKMMKIRINIVEDPTTHRLNEALMFEYLMEEYVRHYELIQKFEAESRKYALIEEMLQKIDAYERDRKASKEELQLFTSCFLVDAIRVDEDVHGKLKGEMVANGMNEPIPLAEFDNEEERYKVYYTIHQVYSQGGKGGKYRKGIEAICASVPAKIDRMVKEYDSTLLRKARGLEADISKINKGAMLLAESKGIPDEVVKFFALWEPIVKKRLDVYERLNDPDYEQDGVN